MGRGASVLAGAMALVLLCAGVVPGAAQAAATTYETLTSPRVWDGRVQQLGAIAIRIDPVVEQEHAAWVSLPRDFVVEEVSVTQAHYNGTDLDMELAGVSGTGSATANPGTEGFELRLLPPGAGVQEILVILSFDQVDIPSGYRGEVGVTFERLTGQLLDSSVVNGRVPFSPDPEEPEDPEEPAKPEEPDEPEPPPIEPPEEPDEPEPPVDEEQTVRLVVDQTTATVNGQEMPLDLAPFIENGRTFVPVRFVAEAFGLQADWSPREGPVEQVFLRGQGLDTTINIGDTAILVEEDGEERIVQADVAAHIRQGRTVLPLRALGEILGAQFEWGPPEGPVEWIEFTR